MTYSAIHSILGAGIESGMMQMLSYQKGLMNAPDGVCACGEVHDKGAKPSPHELELMAKQDRSPRRRKLMAEYFKNIAEQVTQFEINALSLLRLPKIDKIRTVAITGNVPDDETAWSIPDGAVSEYKRLVVEFGQDILGEELYEKSKAANDYEGLEGTYPYYEFNAFTIGMDEEYEQLLRQIDPKSADAERIRRARARATRGNPYLRAVVSDGADRIKEELGLRHIEKILEELRRMARNGKGPIATGRALHDAVGEGQLWYWMRMTRSESALACNAGFQYAQEKYGVPYERWSAGAGACEICTYFGRGGDNIWPRGTGPEPVVDSHPHCMCHLEPVLILRENQTPQPAWARPNPYDKPYDERERRGMEIMNQEAEKYRKRKT